LRSQVEIIYLFLLREGGGARILISLETNKHQEGGGIRILISLETNKHHKHQGGGIAYHPNTKFCSSPSVQGKNLLL